MPLPFYQQRTFWSRYIAATACYGAVRKVPYTWNATIRPFNELEGKRKVVPMLNTTKACAMAIGAGLGPFLWPWHVLGDMECLEIILTGKDIYDYGHEPVGRSALHYMFK